MKETVRVFSSYEGQTPFFVRMAGVTHPDADYRMQRVLSKVVVLEYVVSGEGVLEWDGALRSVSAGHLTLLPRGVPHLYYANPQNPYEKIFLNVSGSLCEAILDSYGITGGIFEDPGLREAFRRIPTLISSELEERAVQASLQGIFLEAVAALSMARAEERFAPEALLMKRYLDANLSRMVSGQELARAVFRSPDYCRKLFLRDFGETPYAYQLRQKLRRAKVLLAETNLPVGQIAAQLGYSDLHYFSNLFYAKTGIRPLRYRRSRR